ncbi:MAG: hypothetical protein II887_01585 [Bacteroidales bacterium]|nr:hypothetical protein [Bacteroidales bacterium]
MSAQPVRRPVGMTVLLIISLVNACMQIFSNLFMFITTPIVKETVESPEWEKITTPFLSAMGKGMAESYTKTMELWTTINPAYFLITGVLFICSLMGVIRMLKLQRVGFHLYSISQLLILITAVAFHYFQITQVPFFSELLITAMFILIYHLYFKRIEFQTQQTPNDNGQAEGE